MRELWRQRGVRTFLLIWAGQIVSLVGSGLTAFALGVWIYQQTASATQYALVTCCAALPPLVVLPLVGPLIDRWPRKRLLVGCDLFGALSTVAVGMLAWAEALSLPLVCLIVAVNASAGAVQWPAWSASVTLLVPRAHLGRASGMTSLAMATSQILAPLVAGALLSTIGLAWIAAIDLATFCFSVGTLLVASIPALAPDARARQARGGYWRSLPLGWNAIFRHAGLAALLVTFTAANFLTEIATVLFTPMVLCMADAAALGTILAAGGAGMVAGSLLMSVWGGPRRAALGAIAFAALGGLVVASAGLVTSVDGLVAVALAFFFLTPLIAGCSQVVWQRVVPQPLQGRVFAARAAVTMAVVPAAALLAGPLADRLFEPAMVGGDGFLARLFGPLVGIGRGRGMASILFLAGLLSTAVILAGGLWAPLRRLDGAVDLPEPAGMATRAHA